MTYLVDTDVVIGFLKGKPQEINLLKTLNPQGISISLMTYGEVLEGIIYATSQKQQEQGFRQFLKEVEVLPPTKRIMRQFATIRGYLRQSGAIIPDMDLLIGVTALQNNLILVTYNKKHFQRIPGLVLY